MVKQQMILLCLTWVVTFVSAQTTRTYYIAADEVEWNYAPMGNMDMHMDVDGDAPVFIESGENRIGSTYIKALYREYTDDTFTTLKEIPEAWQHKGILGPILRGEVGDTIKIIFKNNGSRPYSMHPHGVFYTKESEGTNYQDGSNATLDVVEPGQTYTYTWEVPERAGPGPNDANSVVWLYHSHVDEPKDTYSGLIGAIIVTAKGRAKADGSPVNVDREFITLFHVFNENNTWYLEQNIAKYTSNPASVDVEDEEFEESNLMHAINGYVFDNAPAMVMKRGERVRWYIIGMGTEVDMHTAHWHGNTVLWGGRRTDVVSLLPATMEVADMIPDNPGVWMFHCHVNDHISAGMMTHFEVKP